MKNNLKKHTVSSEMRHHFTLLELLIVIAIIAILAGMLLPALAKVKSLSRASDCINKIKQLGSGVWAYSEDNRAYVPHGDAVARVLFNARKSGGIGDYINLPAGYSYYDNTEKSAIACPLSVCSDGRYDGTSSPTLNISNHNYPNASYALNAYFTAWNKYNPTRYPLHNVNQVVCTSRRMLLIESGIDQCFNFSLVGQSILGERRMVAFRHNKKTSVCFLDLHVETVPYREIPLDKGNCLDDTNFWNK